MKMPLFAFIAIIASVPLEAARSEESQKPGMVAEPRLVEFVGYTRIVDNQVFALHDVATKESSHWIKIGQTWHGCTVVSFDSKAEKLRVKTDMAHLDLNLRSSKIEQAISLPALVSGTYTLVDNTFVYSTEAQLKLGSGALVSSPTGLMVSDPQQKIVAGDLTIQTGNATIRGTDAIVDVEKGRVTGKNVIINIKPLVKDDNLTKR